MRLYLSSYGVGEDPRKLYDLLADNKKVAVILNAGEYSDDTERSVRLARELVSLGEAGLQGDELDLRKYFDEPEDLARKLSEYGLVWLCGGNSFVLRRAIAQSGFDQIIRPMLEADVIAYGGYSAGACVAGSTLKGIDLVDDPQVVPEGYESDVIWEGMHLVDYAIAPHYKTPEHPESEAIDKAVAYFEDHSISYRPLSDGEVIIVNNTNQQR